MLSTSEPTTDECVSAEDLRDYLSGWTDEVSESRIESHLATCSRCEQTVTNLEADHETLSQWLRDSVKVEGSSSSTEEPSAPNHLDHDDPSGNSVLERVKAIYNSPSDAAGIAGSISQTDGHENASLGQALPFQVPARIAGYELLRPLGQGGMGAVYLARHRSLGKLVALKVIRANSQAARVEIERFKREIRAAGGLNHRAIISATDAGEHEGLHFLVMEYVEGLDLGQLSRAIDQMPVADACELMRVVAVGLSHAHAAGIVHRDIKPSNVMLGIGGDVKILDFGLAQIGKWNESALEQTTVGQLMGTLDYMAPEQAENPSAVDYRADLYALGATLFRLIAGRPPLAPTPNMSPLAKLRMLSHATAPRLDTLRDDLPPALVAIVQQLLSRHPEDRPSSAAHVAELLQPLCDGHDLAQLLKLAHERPQSEWCKPWDEAVPSAIASPAEVMSNSNSMRGSLWNYSGKWLMSLGAVGLLLFAVAGILIKLETDKGQLIIESDTADISVRVLQDGEVAKELQLQTGPNSVRLREGKYEVLIAGGADEVRVENGVFKLTKGGIIVARVLATEEVATEGQSLPTAPAQPPPALPNEAEDKRLAALLFESQLQYENMKQSLGESHPSMEAMRQRIALLSKPKFAQLANPTYDNKSLTEWLYIFRNERKEERLTEAHGAIQSLVSPATSDLITQALLDNCKSNGYLATSNPGLQHIIDNGSFAILRQAQADRYPQLILHELTTSEDKDWVTRIIERGLLWEDFNNPDIVAWSRKVIEHGMAGISEKTKLYLCRIVLGASGVNELRPDMREETRQIVLTSPGFPRQLLLQHAKLYEAYADEVINQIRMSIINVLPSRDDTTAACLAVQSILLGSRETEYSEAFKARVRELANDAAFIAAIQTRLEAIDAAYDFESGAVELRAHSDSHLVPLIRLSAGRGLSANGRAWGGDPRARQSIWNITSNMANYLVELLDLIEVLNVQEQLSDPLSQLATRVGGVRDEIKEPFSRLVAATISWPTLQVMQTNMVGGGGRGGGAAEQRDLPSRLTMQDVVCLQIAELLQKDEPQADDASDPQRY